MSIPTAFAFLVLRLNQESERESEREQPTHIISTSISLDLSTHWISMPCFYNLFSDSNRAVVLGEIIRPSIQAIANMSICWLCHEEGPDEQGDPLMSGCCSCRGTSGYFHLSCVVEYAKARTKYLTQEDAVSFHPLAVIWCVNMHSIFHIQLLAIQ